MFVVFGTDSYYGEVYGKGETLEAAIEDFKTHSENGEITEYYLAKPLRVTLALSYTVEE